MNTEQQNVTEMTDEAQNWQTPEVEEIVLSCEISSYSNADMGEDNSEF